MFPSNPLCNILHLKSIIVKITTKGEPIRSQFQFYTELYANHFLSFSHLKVFLYIKYSTFAKEILHILKVHFLDKNAIISTYLQHTTIVTSLLIKAHNERKIPLLHYELSLSIPFSTENYQLIVVKLRKLSACNEHFRLELAISRSYRYFIRLQCANCIPCPMVFWYICKCMRMLCFQLICFR